jgi:hypothetical protein
VKCNLFAGGFERHRARHRGNAGLLPICWPPNCLTRAQTGAAGHHCKSCCKQPATAGVCAVDCKRMICSCLSNACATESCAHDYIRVRQGRAPGATHPRGNRQDFIKENRTSMVVYF